MKIYTKKIFRLSREERKIRLFRFVFGNLSESSKDRKGRLTYSGDSSLSLSLVPAILKWKRSLDGWALALLGLRIHFKTGFGRHV